MAQYQILYWKNIPAQLKVFEAGKRPVARSLPERFQVEIDRIAMDEGLTGTDEYLNQWHWTAKMDRPGTAEEVAETRLPEMDQQSCSNQSAST